MLWGLALVFVLPQVGGAIALIIGGREELDKGQRAQSDPKPTFNHAR